MNDEMTSIAIIEVPEIPEMCLIQFCGDLDGKSTGGIEACFARISRSGMRQVIADMSKVSFITSAALGKLLGVKRRLVERGGDLVLASLGLDLKMKLALLGANKIFKMYNDLRSAANAYTWEIRHETEHVRLSFPAHLDLVPAVRHFINGIVRHKGYSDRDGFRVETIVDEICNNAVQHGPGPGRGRDSIDLRIKVDWDKVEIDAENESDPRKVELLKLHMKHLQEHPAIDAQERRGRGLALVKLLASELSADVTETGTTLHVTKMKEE